jgi:hypothetical protein
MGGGGREEAACSHCDAQSSHGGPFKSTLSASGRACDQEEGGGWWRFVETLSGEKDRRAKGK